MIAQDGAALSVSFYWCQRVQPAFLMPPLVRSVSHREPIRRPRLTIRRRQEFLPDEKSKGGCKSANGRDMCSGTSAAHRRTRRPPYGCHGRHHLCLCTLLLPENIWTKLPQWDHVLPHSHPWGGLRSHCRELAFAQPCRCQAGAGANLGRRHLDRFPVITIIRLLVLGWGVGWVGVGGKTVMRGGASMGP